MDHSIPPFLDLHPTLPLLPLLRKHKSLITFLFFFKQLSLERFVQFIKIPTCLGLIIRQKIKNENVKMHFVEIFNTFFLLFVFFCFSFVLSNYHLKKLNYRLKGRCSHSSE